jgi:uncharacterized membrane protein YjjP (DUF1212 family)
VSASLHHWSPVGPLAQVVDPGQSSTTVPTTSTTTSSSTSTTASSTTTSPSSTTSTSSTSTTPSTTTTPSSTTTEVPADTTVPTTTGATVVRPAVQPAVSDTSVPLGSFVLAAVVLLVVVVLVARAVRLRPPGRSAPEPTRLVPDESDDTEAQADDESLASGEDVGDLEALDLGEGTELGELDEPEIVVTPPVGATSPGRTATGSVAGGSRIETLRFLMEVGRALIDAGDPVDDVQRTVRRVAAVNGIDGIGVVVLPTALMISLPEGSQVQTEVRAAGQSRLRLDQIDEVLRVVEAAEAGAVSPEQGTTLIAAAREMDPVQPPRMRLLGAMLFTLGSAMILRAEWRELLLAALLGLGLGGMQLEIQRRKARPDVQAFWPLLAAFAASTIVFAVARAVPDLSVYPPVIAALVTFLPGGLLTTGVLELSTGQLLSGAGRLASGVLQLTLLAIGVVAGAQLLGVPATTIEASGDLARAGIAWVGVTVLAAGIFLFHGSRRSSFGWMFVVLYVAYAGQVVGGALFGGALSAFFGALAMTPFALVGARQRWGPPMLVSFLPAFWLLVPGALGLVSLTRLLGGDQASGLDVLVTTGTTMIGIALGVLLGTAVTTRVFERLDRRPPVTR